MSTFFTKFRANGEWKTVKDPNAVPKTTTINGVALSGNIDTRLQFQNIAASNWTELSSSAEDYNVDFPWRGELSCSGVTASMIPEVVFGIEDAMSGNFAPVSRISVNGNVYIYAAANPSATVTVPTVVAWR